MIFYFLFACYFRILIFYTTDLNPRINKGIIIIIAVAIVIFIIIKYVHFDVVYNPLLDHHPNTWGKSLGYKAIGTTLHVYH